MWKRKDCFVSSRPESNFRLRVSMLFCTFQTTTQWLLTVSHLMGFKDFSYNCVATFVKIHLSINLIFVSQKGKRKGL